MTNLTLVLPEIFLSLSIMFLLIVGVFKKNSSKLIQNISLIVLLVTAVITFNETLGVDQLTLFNGSIIIDYLSSFMKIVTLQRMNLRKLNFLTPKILGLKKLDNI